MSGVSGVAEKIYKDKTIYYPDDSFYPQGKERLPKAFLEPDGRWYHVDATVGDQDRRETIITFTVPMLADFEAGHYTPEQVERWAVEKLQELIDAGIERAPNDYILTGTGFETDDSALDEEAA